MVSIGKITFVAFLIATFVLGSFLSYLWVLGYYVSLGLSIPETPVTSISELEFDPQKTSLFNMTVMNPSFSSGEIRIVSFNVITKDGVVHKNLDSIPSLPTTGYALRVGEKKAFLCYWDWESYLGQSAEVIVFVAEGSGSSFLAPIPFVNITVAEFNIDTKAASSFKLKVANHADSATFVNVTSIMIASPNATDNIDSTSPSLPQIVQPNASVTLTCYWDWPSHQNQTVTISVATGQGYFTTSVRKISTYVILKLDNVSLNTSDMLHFNLTASSTEKSIVPVNVTRIAITFENGTVKTLSQVTPSLPYILNQNSSVTFACSWNWTSYQNKNATFTITTQEGYTASLTQKTPHTP